MTQPNPIEFVEPNYQKVELPTPEPQQLNPEPLAELQDNTPLDAMPETTEPHDNPTDTRERLIKELRPIVSKVIIANYDGGMKGLIERAAILVTTPMVKPSGYVTFPGCSDCIKNDATTRTSTFPIPYGIKIPVCEDCEQKKKRVFPQYMCNLCPTEHRLKDITELLMTILVGIGVKPQFDKDGCYVPSPKGKVMAEEERINMILDNIIPDS